MNDEYKLGQRARMLKTVIDLPSGDSPGCVCADEGEIVIVRSVHDCKYSFPIQVSHEYITDGRTFGVSPSEIEPAPSENKL